MTASYFIAIVNSEFDNDREIYGVGETEKAAISDAEAITGPSDDENAGFVAIPCTKALYEKVRAGGACAWGYLDRWTACTVQEEEAA